MISIALDSNILAYLAGVCRVPADTPKIKEVRRLITMLSPSVKLIAPAQALGELFVVLRRAGADPQSARSVLLEFAQAFDAPQTSPSTVSAAADLVVDHRLQFWDAVILSASADAGCQILLSEDMQSGFVARGVTVINPLATSPHPKLAQLLAAS